MEIGPGEDGWGSPMAPENLDLWQNWPERLAFPPQPHKATKERRDPTQDTQSRGKGEGRVVGTQLLWVSTGQALGTSTWTSFLNSAQCRGLDHGETEGRLSLNMCETQ